MSLRDHEFLKLNAKIDKQSLIKEKDIILEANCLNATTKISAIPMLFTPLTSRKNFLLELV